MKKNNGCWDHKKSKEWKKERKKVKQEEMKVKDITKDWNEGTRGEER